MLSYVLISYIMQRQRLDKQVEDLHAALRDEEAKADEEIAELKQRTVSTAGWFYASFVLTMLIGAWKAPCVKMIAVYFSTCKKGQLAELEDTYRGQLCIYIETVSFEVYYLSSRHQLVPWGFYMYLPLEKHLIAFFDFMQLDCKARFAEKQEEIYTMERCGYVVLQIRMLLLSWENW